MSKIVDMKKRLLREGGLSFAILAVVAGVVFGLDSYVASKDAEGHKQQGSIQALGSQSATLEKKITLVQSSIEEYQQLKAQQDAKQFSTDREQARNVINQMRQEFRLSNLKIEISPETVFDDQGGKYTTMDPTYRDLKITFSAITDLHVYAFIDALPKRLPGFLKPAEINIHRDKPIVDEVLALVAKGDEPELVGAELHYLWTGIRVKPKPGAAAGGPNAPL